VTLIVPDKPDDPPPPDGGIYYLPVLKVRRTRGSGCND
jgi:hypothetical protein